MNPSHDSRSNSTGSDSHKAERPRIAVIAVHGVADQQPGDSAADIAGLLLSLPKEQYIAFHGDALHVPLEPVVLAKSDRDRAQQSSAEAEVGRSADAGVAVTPSVAARVKHSLSERRGYLAQGRAGKGTAARVDGGARDEAAWLANEAMRMRLAGYKGARDRATYITTRLQGQRKDGTRVDVFEMHWADLSRVATGPLAFFGAVYQLLLHLAELGRQAVDDAAYEHGSSGIWRWLSNMQAYAVRLLVLPIVLLNVILLTGSLAPVVVRLLSVPAARLVSSALGAVFAVSVAFALFRKSTPTRRRTWGVVPIGALALGGAAGFGVAWIVGPARLPILTSVEWWLAVWALLHFMFRQYARVRPGALWVGHVLYLLCASAFVGCLIASGDGHRASYYPGATVTPLWTVALGRAEQATVWTIQLVWVTLRALWFTLWFLVIATALLGYVATRATGGGEDDDARRSRAHAALRTGRLALSLSSLGFLLLTVVLWLGAFSYTAQKSEAFQCLAPTAVPLPASVQNVILVPNPQGLAAWLKSPGMPTDSPCPGSPSVREYFRALFVLSTSTGLVATIAFAGVGLLLLGWMALPSVFTEAGEAAERTDDASKRMGAWLSRGLDSTSAVTWLFWIAIFVIPPLCIGADFLARNGALPPGLTGFFQRLLQLTVSTIGVIAAVTASAAVIIASVVKFGGSALDVMLDVDNYLRTLPEDGTPRARITERYVSLLRYIAAVGVDTDKQEPPYRAIVIVAHSLGALITADLLRFLNDEARTGACHGDPRLTRLGYGPSGTGHNVPIYLFTMGNPLRQLLNRFFPHQYRWVRERPDNGLSPLPGTPPQPAIEARARPALDQLGVARWDSAYRSGDYVGRSVWLNEWYERTTGTDGPDPTLFEEGGRAEECIGVGAHTHYWDRTAPEIAKRVDVLVSMAVHAAEQDAALGTPSLTVAGTK